MVYFDKGCLERRVRLLLRRPKFVEDSRADGWVKCVIHVLRIQVKVVTDAISRVVLRGVRATCTVCNAIRMTASLI